MRSEYFPSFQCTKRIKFNLLIPLHKFKKDTSKLFIHIYRLKNMLAEIFDIPLVDFMYDLMCTVFFGPKFAYFLGLRPFKKNVTNYGQKLN